MPSCNKVPTTLNWPSEHILYNQPVTACALKVKKIRSIRVTVAIDLWMRAKTELKYIVA